MRKVKIGEVALRMVARPASMERSAAAISVKGTTLFRQAWKAKRRQLAASIGMPRPRQRIKTRRIPPAIKARAAMNVTGGALDANLDEAVGRAPQHRQHGEQGQVGRHVGLCRHGRSHLREKWPTGHACTRRRGEMLRPRSNSHDASFPGMIGRRPILRCSVAPGLRRDDHRRRAGVDRNRLALFRIML